MNPNYKKLHDIEKEALNNLVHLMITALVANQHKDNWRNLSAAKLNDLAMEKVMAIGGALRTIKKPSGFRNQQKHALELAMEACVDGANYLMMVFDMLKTYMEQEYASGENQNR